MPVVIEMVDVSDKLERFLESIVTEIQAGMVTLERVQVRLYRGALTDKTRSR